MSAKLISFVNNIVAFNRFTPQEKVYLHFDNTTYFIGETIWFKAYVVDAYSFQPTLISGVLYVELLNDAGITQETKKLKIENGQCNGEFMLQNRYESGFYQIRAYTRYMLNFGNETHGYYYNGNFITPPTDANYCLFSRVFPVYNKPDSVGDYALKRMSKSPRHTALNFPDMEKKKSKNPVELSFYPEGGNLVNGLENTIAFEACESSTRKPIALAGKIVDNAGKQVTEFQTMHNGRGLFHFSPEVGKTYSAHFFFDGKIYNSDLPKAKPYGYVMHIESTQKKVKAVIAKSEELSSELLGISVMCRGKLQFFDTLTVGSKILQLNFPLDKVPAGVYQVTLFNATGNIYSERLFFVYPPNVVQKIRSIGKTENLIPYEQIHLGFEWKDAENNPVKSVFSLSVSDKETREESYYTDNICTDLLLSSDLKGFVENASSYFTDTTKECRQRLDLLMLVQGWRRYPWKEMAGIDKFELKYRPEPALTIDGYLLNWKNRPEEYDNLDKFDRLKNANIKMTLYSDSLRFEQTYNTNTDGWFSFVLDNDVYGKHKMILKITDRKKGEIMEKGIPVLDRAFSPDIDSYSYYETHFPFESYIFGNSNKNDSILKKEIKGKELGEVFVNGKSITRGVIHYEFPDIEIGVQEYEDWETDLLAIPHGTNAGILFIPLAILSRYRIHGLIMTASFEADGKRYPLRAYSGGGYGNFFKPERVQAIKFYFNKLVREQYADKLNSSDNKVPAIVTSFLCYPNNGTRPIYNENGIRHTTFIGYDRPLEFYNPDYSTTPLPELKDYRRTLYWNPDVKTDSNGRATVQFYNNSTCKQIHISAEGVTSNGIPVVGKE